MFGFQPEDLCFFVAGLALSIGLAYAFGGRP